MDLGILKGYYILDGDQITYFPKHYLPIQIDKRFKELFSVRHKWQRDDIMPYSIES